MGDDHQMLPRRLEALTTIPVAQRLPIIAEGLQSLARSVAALEADATDLASKASHQGAATLRCFADEEAAKVLILLDIVRSGWRDQKGLSSSLSRFYDHLARGLYVVAYEGRPADLAEVRRMVDGERRAFYLDGPMDVDWIFRNEVLTTREQRLYVDYVEYDDGCRRWVGPAEHAEIFDEPFSLSNTSSTVIQLVAALDAIGLLTLDGLEAIRAVWKKISVTDQTHWQEVRELNVQVVKAIWDDDAMVESARTVVEKWIFPLTSLDMSLTNVDMQDLRRRQDAWLARELGYDDGFM